MDALLSSIMSYALSLTAHLPILAAVVTRISAIAFLAPGIGEPVMPMRLRLAAIAALSMVVAPPLLTAPIELPVDAGGFSALIIAEALIGLLLGFALRLCVFILQMTGTIAAQHLSLSQLLGPGIGHDQETPLSGILVMGGIALAAAAGFHFELASAVLRSYDAFPAGVFPDAADVGEWASNQSAAAITAAFALAIPFVVLGFAYTILLAAMSRAMPQLMAAFVGAPAILFAGLVLFGATASVILDHWLDIATAVLADPIDGLR